MLKGDGFAFEATEQRNVRIRILMPRHELTNELVYSLTGRTSKYNNIDLRYIKQTRLDTHVTFLIVDEKVSLVMEIRDDSKGTFDEAIGYTLIVGQEFYHIFPSLKIYGYKLNYMIKLRNQAYDWSKLTNN